jgi:hypothetical protein
MANGTHPPIIVSEDQVAETVRELIEFDGVGELHCEKTENGSWRIVAM